MPQRNIRGENVGSQEPFAHQVRQFSTRYNQLLGVLARTGTEIERSRILETDPDIAPYSFIRGAAHVFVFPPQPDVKLMNNEGEEVGVVPGTAPYTLTRESQVAEPDPSLVKGRIRLFYEDAGDTPLLQLVDMLEDESIEAASVLPHEVQVAIDAAFEPIEAPTSTS